MGSFRDTNGDTTQVFRKHPCMKDNTKNHMKDNMTDNTTNNMTNHMNNMNDKREKR